VRHTAVRTVAIRIEIWTWNSRTWCWVPVSTVCIRFCFLLQEPTAALSLRLITLFTTSSYWSLSWARSMQHALTLFLKDPFLILFSHIRPSECSLPSGFPVKTLYFYTTTFCLWSLFYIIQFVHINIHYILCIFNRKIYRGFRRRWFMKINILYVFHS
jgi:hypothetical protein